MRGFFVALFALLVSLPSLSEAAPRVRIVVLGDSLTSGFQIGKGGGYASRLGDKLEARGYSDFTIIDMSSANMSSLAGYQKTSNVLRQNPDIVILGLGMDDAAKETRPEIINQYVGITIGALQQRNVGVVLLGVDAPPGAKAPYKAQLEAVYKSLANHYRVAFVPNILRDVITRPELALADKYRPNAKGVDKMVELSYALVGQYIRTIVDTKQPIQFDPNDKTAPLPPVQPVPEGPGRPSL